jgi:hypothetical protein
MRATSDIQSVPGGVCSHSTPMRWKDWAIFCVGNDPYREAAFTTWATSMGIKFKSLIGSYKGLQERSFLLSLDDFVDNIEGSQWIEQEESVLVLQPRRKANGEHLKTYDAPIDAILLYSDGRKEHIGEWVETHQARAITELGWTYDPLYGTWFIVV